MEDSTNIVRPHKPYVKHGRPAEKGRKRYSPPKTAQEPTIALVNRKAVISPVKGDKLKKTRGLEKIRVMRLLLAGASAQSIADQAKLSLDYCTALLKDLDEDLDKFEWKDYLSVLLSKLRLILDNHTQNSADIQLLLLSVDQDITANETAIEVIGGSNKKEQQHLQAIAGRLRKERLELMRELNANNLALTTNLSKMGVTTRPPSQENKVPTQSSIAGGFTELEEIPIGYEKMDRAALMEGLAESQKAVNRLMKAERDKKRALEGGSE